MKRQQNIPYGKISAYVAVIILMAALSGYVWATARHAHLIATIPIIIFCLLRLFHIYNELVERLMFVFNAVQNDDYSFRFTENPNITRHALVNQSLNRIKEVMDNAKMQIREREKYFELIMECAAIGIVTVMENGTVAQTNTKALRIVGMERLNHIDQLRILSEELCEAMHRIEPGAQLTARFATEIGDQNLVLNCSAMEFGGKQLRVISIGNIHEELDRKEVESWEKLTRILTHEIMNSLAPVTSISHTLLSSSGDAETMRQGLETIHTTSDRLLRFVDSFRAVTRIPAPQKAPFYLSELVAESLSLIPHEGIEVETSIEPENTMLYADRALMSQVMVNLLKNASEALLAQDCDRKITIHSTIDTEERIQIEITNNGKAIPAEVAENIFTPFFTTKTDGSGIGLAVSRQIVRLHGGSLRLKHNSEGRVTFAIVVE
ncbi:MAG: GHKL domain-containing protein [Alistipes sp.]|nr:GHKL domain-containing protein [Alistipes sp.]MBR3892968.1 GHKL domain-containing protein [Alistipes sp.]